MPECVPCAVFAIWLKAPSYNPAGVFGGRGRGMPGAGRGQQEKKPGKPQGVKNQH